MKKQPRSKIRKIHFARRFCLAWLVLGCFRAGILNADPSGQAGVEESSPETTVAPAAPAEGPMDPNEILRDPIEIQKTPSFRVWTFELSGFVARVRFGPRQGEEDLPQLESRGALGLNLSVPFEAIPMKFVFEGSLGGRWSGSYRSVNSEGKEVTVEPSSSKSRAVSLNLKEVYIAGPSRDTFFLGGKARIPAGPSLATSLINPLAPEKDPVFPYSDTTGKWVFGWQSALPAGLVSLYASPGVLENGDGIPTAVWEYKAEPWASQTLHGQATLLAYAGDPKSFIGGSISVLSLAPDTQTYGPRFGLMGRRQIDDSVSVHFESSARQGSERWQADPICSRTEEDFLNCLDRNKPIFRRPKLESKDWNAQFVLGGKRILFEDTQLALEWYYNTAGETAGSFRELLVVSDFAGKTKKRTSKNTADARRVNSEAFEKMELQLQKALGNGDQNALRGRSSLLASLHRLPVLVGLWASGSTALSLRDNSGLAGVGLGVDVRGGEFELKTVFPYTLGAWKGVESKSGERLSESETLPYRYRIEARLKVVL